jgi:hypothetical protein
MQARSAFRMSLSDVPNRCLEKYHAARIPGDPPKQTPVRWGMAAGSANSKRGKGVLSVGEAPDRVVMSMLNDALYRKVIRISFHVSFPHINPGDNRL